MQPDFFMHSQSSVRDDYKSWNLGSRNGAVRDVSYAAATQRLEEMGLQSEAWLHELRTRLYPVGASGRRKRLARRNAGNPRQCRGRRHGEEGACVRADRADTSCRVGRKGLTSQRSRRL